MRTACTLPSACADRRPPSTIRVAALLILPAMIALLDARLAGVLEFDRRAITDGEWWRLLTCHWAHWNAFHAIWDILVFGCLAAEVARRDRAVLIAIVSLAAISVGAAVWLVSPDMHQYRGLSGIAAGLLAYWGVAAARDQSPAQRWVGAATLLTIVAKVFLELTTGRVLILGESAGFAPAPIAHAAGGLAGAAIALLEMRLRRPFRVTARQLTTSSAPPYRGTHSATAITD